MRAASLTVQDVRKLLKEVSPALYVTVSPNGAKPARVIGLRVKKKQAVLIYEPAAAKAERSKGDG